MRYSKTEQHLVDQNYVQIQVQIQDDNVNSILYLQSLIVIELIGLCACNIHHILDFWKFDLCLVVFVNKVLEMSGKDLLWKGKFLLAFP